MPIHLAISCNDNHIKKTDGGHKFSEFVFFINIGGYLKEFTDEESNFTAILQRAMDLEGVDRETVYQLVALLMKVC